MAGSASRSRRKAGGTAPIERLRAICTALPETHEQPSPVGSTFRIRRRVFVTFFVVADPQGNEHAMLSCRADPDEREALVRIGHPYFPTPGGIGLLIDGATDWTEVAELATESYRICAPKKLAANIEPPALTWP